MLVSVFLWYLCFFVLFVFLVYSLYGSFVTHIQNSLFSRPSVLLLYSYVFTIKSSSATGSKCKVLLLTQLWQADWLPACVSATVTVSPCDVLHFLFRVALAICINTRFRLGHDLKCGCVTHWITLIHALWSLTPKRDFAINIKKCQCHRHRK